jgi:hypothetical protein
MTTDEIEMKSVGADEGVAHAIVPQRAAKVNYRFI